MIILAENLGISIDDCHEMCEKAIIAISEL